MDNNDRQTELLEIIAQQQLKNEFVEIGETERALAEAHNRKVGFAIAAGICTVGMIAATYFSGVDMDQAIATEMKAINSGAYALEYLKTITPGMYLTMAGAAVTFVNYLKANRREKEAQAKLNDLTGIDASRLSPGGR